MGDISSNKRKLVDSSESRGQNSSSSTCSRKKAGRVIIAQSRLKGHLFGIHAYQSARGPSRSLPWYDNLLPRKIHSCVRPIIAADLDIPEALRYGRHFVYIPDPTEPKGNGNLD